MEQLKKKAKFWTLQKREVLARIQEEGIYYPDFSLSDFVGEEPELSELYQFMLCNYNKVNGTGCRGLVFSFFSMYGRDLCFFPDFGHFRSFILEKKNAVFSLWNKLISRDCVVLELEVESALNPLFIDINHFQLLMPPISILPPYTESDVKMIIGWLKNGTIGKGYEDPALIQAHLPYIRKEDIVGTYAAFGLE